MSPTLASALKHKASVTTEKGLGRAHDILRAARTLLATEGYAGLSMRRVAADVGISLSNVQHYYQSKDALLEALLLYTMDVFQSKMDSISAAMTSEPRLDQLLSTCDMFLEEITDPVTHAIFFEIWALASRNAFASNLMDTMMARERKAIFKLIRGLNPAIGDEQYRQRAILMVAQIEGLMLFRLDKTGRRDEFLAVRASVRKVLLALATIP
ncbi:TetR/AcrR family transcriptional regulator [Massilia sp. CCM 8734]|uniref:TetR/AcrR family transcriptional regulator n=1 Tax=Massilia sp. CCM 8734 TaxID=2609283 RepID=UPI00142081C9|nr:TetR/AcrR family transcriptional regulator [Massilia sp. CCM 8734]NHZ95587.1 TetR family transcriptional regulator [Massilia sp. CCM 8734]